LFSVSSSVFGPSCKEEEEEVGLYDIPDELAKLKLVFWKNSRKPKVKKDEKDDSSVTPKIWDFFQ